MGTSRQRRKDAVNAARDVVYGHIDEMPTHFDERQAKIFNDYVSYFRTTKSYFDGLEKDMNYIFGLAVDT